MSEQFSHSDVGSTAEITSHDGLGDSIDVTGVETYSGIEGQGGTSDQVQVDGDVLVAQPPKERDGSDYSAVAISGTSALFFKFICLVMNVYNSSMKGQGSVVLFDINCTG